MKDGQKTRPNDARAARSRAALRSALLGLLEQHNFDRISIRQIAAAASLSYPTFFRNYSSKTDLLGEIAADEVRQLLSLMYSHIDKGDIRGNAVGICGYVEARRVLWTALLTNGASSVMREEFSRIAQENVQERGRINPGLPLDMVSAWVAGGLFDILAWWLRQPADYPARHVASFLELLVLEPSAVPHVLPD